MLSNPHETGYGWHVSSNFVIYSALQSLMSPNVAFRDLISLATVRNSKKSLCYSGTTNSKGHYQEQTSNPQSTDNQPLSLAARTGFTAE